MIQLRRDPGGSAGARFGPGAIVFHRHYRYRGVVVELDLTCQADDDWYQRNQTQPDRDQPWYHVLVDRAVHTTYVAEENLMLDPGGAPVHHPLVPVFFSAHGDGRYVRNGREWGS